MLSCRSHMPFSEVGNACGFRALTYGVQLMRDETPPQLLLATIDGHGGPVELRDQQHILKLYFSELLQPLRPEDMERCSASEWEHGYSFRSAFLYGARS